MQQVQLRNFTVATVYVSGKSGFLGEALVTALGAAHTLTFLDREKGPVAAELELQDIVYHLAARNNDRPGDLADFVKDNADLTVELYLAACAAGVKKFIFVSTTHAADPQKTDAYSLSKRQAEADLLAARQEGCDVTIVRFPAIWGAGAKGATRIISKLPPMLQGVGASVLRSLVPIVKKETAVQTLVQVLNEDDLPQEIAVSDNLSIFSLYGAFVFVLNAVFVLAVAVLLPILFVLAVIIRLDSPGAALFVQPRVGRFGRVFKCIKFRTMFVDTDERPSHQHSHAQVTKLGRILRASKLDELPQAWNVLLGQMTLIGPRPGLLSQTELRSQRERYGVFTLSPGISGLSQIQKIDMSTPLKLSIVDARYICMRSILVDIKIAIATVLGRGGGDLVEK